MSTRNLIASSSLHPAHGILPAIFLGLVALVFDTNPASATGSERDQVLAAWRKDFTQVQRIDPPISGDGAAQDAFGSALAIQGDTAIIGAPRDDRDGQTNVGSAYVYVRIGDAWVFQAKLAPGPVPIGNNHWLGYAVAIDGDTAVVGAPEDMFSSTSGPGRAVVYTRSGTVWTQRAILLAGDPANVDRFGSAVAVDQSTGTIVVGSQRDDNAQGSDAGAVYVFTGSGATWSQQAKLIGATVTTSSWYGYSVDIDDDTILVGARRAVVGGASSGAAYVHVRSAGMWSEQARLSAPAGALNDAFGWSVAIDGDTAVAGAPFDDYGATTDAGSAYVFVRSAGAWSLQGSLLPAVPQTGDLFGTAVDVVGDRVLVGAANDDTPVAVNSGAGYVFDRNAGIWSLTALLYGATWSDQNGDQGGSAVALSVFGATVGAPVDQTDAGIGAGTLSHFDDIGGTWGERQRITSGNIGSNVQFGISVAVDADTAVVGARYLGSDTCYGCGAAFVYHRSAGQWQLASTLRAAPLKNDAFFGSSVAVAGDQILVGAPNDGSFGLGTVHRFTRNADAWIHAQRFEPTGPSIMGFGSSIDFDGQHAIVGAPTCFNEVSGQVGGCAFILDAQSGVLVQQARLQPASGEAAEQFGVAVAIAGDTALVGAHLHDGAASANAGAAFVFTEVAGSWTEQATLLAAGLAAGDEFGISVALSGDLAVVGAHRDDHVSGPVDAGSVYVFQGAGASWTELQQLTALGAAASDGFGRAVALAGSRLLIGDSLDDTAAGSNAGSFFEFNASAGVWTQSTQEFASDALPGDQLGQALAVSGNTAVIGAFGRDSAADGGDAGSAYFFGLVSADTSTTITAHDPAASVVGQPYQVEVTVSGSGGTPGGAVTVSDGSADCIVTLAGGSGNCSLTSTSAGMKTLIASYAGDTTFNPSTSAGVAHEVARAATQTAIVSDTPDPSLPGQSVDVQVSLSVLAPGSGLINASVLVAAVPSGANCAATIAAGSGGCVLVLASVADETLTATFAGDSNFVESTSATETHAVQAGADLVATVDNGVAALTAGLTTQYQIGFSNLGPDAAMAAGVSTQLPANLIDAGWSCIAAGGASCVSGLPAGSSSAGNGSINASVDLPSGGSIAYVLNATLAASAQGSVALAATVSSAAPDPSPGNRSATDTDVVQRVVALSIIKINGCDYIPGGSTTTYTIDVANAGPSDVSAAAVQDLLPAELASATWVCTPQPGSGCVGSGSGDIDQLVDIAAGSGLQFELTASVALGPEVPISNSASVTRPAGDQETVLSDNLSTDTDPIRMYVDGFEVACGGE